MIGLFDRWWSSARPDGPAGPGLHGKVPALGDFVSRNLPADVLRRWDDWLQEWLQASRQGLGDPWRSAWLRAPLWHCALGSGLLGPTAWRGVLIPSVDRVGRDYPFTVLAPMRAEGVAPAYWHERGGALALEALLAPFDLEALQDSLVSLGLPAAGDGPSPALGWSWQAEAPDQGRVLEQESLWWCRPDAVRILVLRTRGLPSSERAASMVSGVPPEA